MAGKVPGNGQETHSNLEDLLQGFGSDPALRVAVERMYPNPGYLRLFPIPPGGPDLLFQVVREKHGPGTYRFRPYGTRAGGKPGYLPGSVTLELADMGEADVAPRGNAYSGAAPPAVVVRDNGGLAPELLRALLDRRDPTEAMVSLFGRVLLDRNSAPATAAAGDPLEQFERYLALVDRLRRRGERGEQQQQQQQQQPEENLEGVMLRAIIDKVFQPPQQQQQQQHPQQQQNPQQQHPQRSATPRRTRPQAPPTSPAPPPRVDMHTSMSGVENEPEEDDGEEDEGEDDTLSLEDDLAEHLRELAETPDQAVAWLVQNVFRNLDPRVLSRLGELQRQVEQQQHQQQQPQQQPASVVPLHGFGERGTRS